MTLFRKVFPNQSQPASSEEALDDAALRKVFQHMETTPPLALDPFAKASEAVSERPARDDAPVVEEMEAEAGEVPENAACASSEDRHGELAGASARSAVCSGAPMEKIGLGADEDEAPEYPEVSDGAEPAAGTRGYVSVEDAVEDLEAADDTAPHGFSEKADEDEGVQSDEDIVASLGRALAAEAPASDDEADRVMAAHGREHFDAPIEAEEPREPDTTPVDVPRRAAEAPEEDTPEKAAVETPLDLSAVVASEAVPAPAAGRSGRRAGRAKTRLLGFNRTGDVEHDPFGQAPGATASAQSEKYPVGWLVIVEGPGVGHAFSIFTGASMIGRGEDQVIRLDFGDNSISRQNHAAIAYDEEQNKFYIGHGGKSNIIRRNARPVLSTEELHHADLIRIGETTLRFVALCGSDFQWTSAGGANDPSA